MTVHAEYKTTNQLPPPVPRSESNFSLSSQVGFPLLLSEKFNFEICSQRCYRCKRASRSPSVLKWRPCTTWGEAKSTQIIAINNQHSNQHNNQHSNRHGNPKDSDFQGVRCPRDWSVTISWWRRSTPTEIEHLHVPLQQFSLRSCFADRL